jgi:quercetin dioxygenase-like cupin family protein
MSTTRPTRNVDPGAALLGPRLKAARRQAGKSLAEVAAATAISKSFLALVESGQSDIVFSRLLRLVEFYGIRLGDLLGDDDREYVVVRGGEGRTIASSEEGMTLEVLLPDGHRAIRTMIVTLVPGGRMNEHAWHEGEEFIHVLQGTTVLDLEGVGEITLRRGDSAYYDSTRGHAYHNDGRAPARVLSVVAARPRRSAEAH